MADKNKSGSSNKRHEPVLEYALRAEKEEVDRLEQEQEQEQEHEEQNEQAQSTLVCYDPQAKSPLKDKDKWSDASTAVLLDFYATHYKPRRRGMTSEHWLTLKDVINKRIDNPSLHKTLQQLHNKINSLKKRYRKDCARGSNKWTYFSKMKDLMEDSEDTDEDVVMPTHAVLLASPLALDLAAPDDRAGGEVRKRERGTNAGPDEHDGHDIRDEIHPNSKRSTYAEKDYNNNHGNSGFKRDPHCERTGHPTFPEEEQSTNPGLALAKAFDHFSKVYEYVEKQKVQAYTALVTKLVDHHKK